MEIIKSIDKSLEDRVLEFLELEPSTGYIFDEVKITQYKERPQFVNLKFIIKELSFDIYVTPNDDNLCFVWHSCVDDFNIRDAVLLTWENIYFCALAKYSRAEYTMVKKDLE